MPNHWQETTLGDVADWFAGGTPKATNPAFYTDGQIPWAVIADLLNDPVVETAKHINEVRAEKTDVGEVSESKGT